MIDLRIGHGYDVHRLVEGRPLILGGVTIPYERGLLGHSDADVLAHAVMDALLGAAALGDIGGMFPDSDERWRDADSLHLLEQVAARMPCCDSACIMRCACVTERAVIRYSSISHLLTRHFMRRQTPV